MLNISGDASKWRDDLPLHGQYCHDGKTSIESCSKTQQTSSYNLSSGQVQRCFSEETIFKMMHMKCQLIREISEMSTVVGMSLRVLNCDLIIQIPITLFATILINPESCAAFRVK